MWELRRIVNERIIYHNVERRHSALGNRAPLDYIHDEEILPRPLVTPAQPSTKTGTENRSQILSQIADATL